MVLTFLIRCGKEMTLRLPGRVLSGGLELIYGASGIITML